MREKTAEEIVPVTLDALHIFRKEALREFNKYNNWLKICNERIEVAEKELKLQASRNRVVI